MYGFGVFVFFLYSIALYKVAQMSKDTSSELIEPGALFDDIASGQDDFALVEKDCSFPQISSLSSGCSFDDSNVSVACVFQKTTVDTTKILLTNEGGEDLKGVMKQPEDVEIVSSYLSGAFNAKDKVDATIVSKINELESDQFRPLLGPILSSFQMGSSFEKECTSVPTVFLSRHGYVNLRHTIFDLLNVYGATYAAFPHVNMFNVAFLDAHPEGSFDSIWSKVFKGDVYHIKKSPPIQCYSQIILPSPWYMSPLLTSYSSSTCTPVPKLMDSFLTTLYSSYHIDESLYPSSDERVVIINRQPYIGHPRSDMENFPRVVSNFQDLKDSLLEEMPQLEVILARPETLRFKDQLLLFQSASVLIGTSGSGLTNLLLLPNSPKTTLSIELDPQSSSYSQYPRFAQWKTTKHIHLQLQTNVQEGNSGTLDASFINEIVNLVQEHQSCEKDPSKVLTKEYSWGKKLICSPKNTTS